MIVCPKDKPIASRVLRKFQEDYFENVKSTVHNIQEWKKNKLMLESKTVTAQVTKSNSTSSPHFEALLSPHSDSVVIKSPLGLMSNGNLRGFVAPNNITKEKSISPTKLDRTSMSSSKLPLIVDVTKRITDIIDASSALSQKSPPGLKHHTRESTFDSPKTDVGRILPYNIKQDLALRKKDFDQPYIICE